ncbi:GGDEF domain-containing protein [Caminibacter pacificus]
MNLKHYKIRITIFLVLIFVTFFAIFLNYEINKKTIECLKENLAKKIYILRKNELLTHEKDLAKFLKNFNNATITTKVQKPGYKINDDSVVSVFRINDKTIIIKDSIKEEISPLLQLAKINLIVISIISLMFFGIMFLFIDFLLKRFKKVRNIIAHIKQREFEKLPPLTPEKNICDEFRNEIIKLGREIETYIKLLSLKVEDYKKKAYIDELTHTFNRNFLKEIESKIFLKAKVSSFPTSVIMIDIDDFKKINDTYGHKKGDEVLTHIAKILQNNLRKEDILIRYGGEEFLILLNETELHTALAIAKKLIKAVESNPLNNLKATISAGVSKIEYNDKNLYDSVKRADSNLYKAKRNGKNRVEI